MRNEKRLSAPLKEEDTVICVVYVIFRIRYACMRVGFVMSSLLFQIQEK